MEQPEKMGGNLLRHFLISGSLNGGTFAITLSSAKHVSAKDVLVYFMEHNETIIDLKITSIYEFPDEQDYLDFKGESDGI